MKILILCLIYSFNVYSQVDSLQQTPEENKDQLQPLPTERVDLEKNIMPSPLEEDKKQALELINMDSKKWSAYGSYSYFDTWLPGKMGASATYGDKDRTYELAFQTARYGLDIFVSGLGSITDSRIHLTTRSFPWSGSFNYQYGIVYNSFQVKLGDSFTASAVGASVDVLKVQSIGAMWGLGNRFKISKSFRMGVDWFKIFVPLKVLNKQDDYIDSTTDANKKSDAKDVIDILSKTPTFSLLHLELGYQF